MPIFFAQQHKNLHLGERGRLSLAEDGSIEGRSNSLAWHQMTLATQRRRWCKLHSLAVLVGQLDVNELAARKQSGAGRISRDRHREDTFLPGEVQPVTGPAEDGVDQNAQLYERGSSDFDTNAAERQGSAVISSDGEAGDHGHAHGAEKHGHGADNHGHGHGAENHGHGADNHGHAHGADNHGHSHDGFPKRLRMEKRNKEKWTCRGIRKTVWMFMCEPESSRGAFLTSTLILMLICVSSTTFCLETMEEFDNDRSKQNFISIELLCITAFTIEYLLRLWSAPNTFEFVKAPMNVIDLVAILPFYIEKLAEDVGGLGDTRILRIVRLVRVFRVLKLGGRFSKMQVVGGAVLDSMDMLGMLGFLLLLSMILFSTLIYICERDEESAGDPFSSIPASFWWCIVTLMTVGYGDAVPKTTAGQIVASLAMLASIIILALPISVIGANFTQQWIVYKDQMKMKEQAHKMKPCFVDLVRSLHEHNCVMEELLQEIRVIETNLTDTVALIRTKLAQQLNSRGADLGDVRASLVKIVTLQRDVPPIEAVYPDTPSLITPLQGASEGQSIPAESPEQLQVTPQEMEEHFQYANTLQDMLEERLKQLQLISSEEFSNLMQLCQKLQKTAGRRVDEGKMISKQVDSVQSQVEEVSKMFQAMLQKNSVTKWETDTRR